MNWSALSSLPVWAQASRSSNAPGVLTTATVQGGLVTFLLGARVTSKAAETTEVIHLCIQEGKEFLQRKLLVDVKFPSKDVKDVGPEPFQQILVACGARALALFSPSCCAVVALPLETARMDAPQRCEALVLSPRQGLSFIKVAWHQRSDAHLGVLSSDGSWSLLNLALSLDEAEVYFPALGPDPFVDFLFVAPAEDETPEDAWLSMTVFFLTAAGRISFRTPVIPSATVLSHSSYEALQVALAYAGSVDTFAAAVAGSMTAVAKENVVLATHRHHLHAAASTSFSSSTGLLEQVIKEPREDVSTSTNFCSLQVCCTSPLVVLARATPSGLVELLALETQIGPFASAPAVSARVLEEIDLMCNKSTIDDFVRLDADHSGLIVHSRSLLASIAVSLSTGSAAGSSASVATVSTLAETRSNDMEFASWSLVEKGVGLLLRMERGAKDGKSKASAGGSSSSKSFLTVIEMPKKDSTSSDKGASFGGPLSKLSPSSSLHLLEQPLGLPAKTVSVAKPAEVAKRVASLRSGIASIHCRQDFLKHLAQKSFPARAEALQQELTLETSELRRRASEGQQRARKLQERQAELVQRQAALVKALSDASEARHLEELNDAVVPKLYAQLYELRRAGELLRSSQQAPVTDRETLSATQRPLRPQLMLAPN